MSGKVETFSRLRLFVFFYFFPISIWKCLRTSEFTLVLPPKLRKFLTSPFGNSPGTGISSNFQGKLQIQVTSASATWENSDFGGIFRFKLEITQKIGICPDFSSIFCFFFLVPTLRICKFPGVLIFREFTIFVYRISV